MSDHNPFAGKTYTQDQHRAINASNYPGTRQICSICDEPTGRCEDDSIYVDDQPVCEDCYERVNDTEQIDDQVQDLLTTIVSTNIERWFGVPLDEHETQAIYKQFRKDLASLGIRLTYDTTIGGESK